MRAVILFSGGLDSTVLLAKARAVHDEVHALSFDYGQRHGARELGAASRVLLAMGHPAELARTIDLRALRPLLRGSSQTDDAVPVPHGHYAEESMKATIVPNRNMVMLSIAAAYAISLRADVVGYAAHRGDHAIYPDCRPEFASALGAAIALADWHAVLLWTPLIDLDKAEIVRRGSALGAPLGETWSCYEGGDIHCGRCGTCIERREAFESADVEDPTAYAP